MIPLVARVLILVVSLGSATLSASVSTSDLGTFKLLHRVIDKCGDSGDVFSCLKLKAVALLDRALTVDTLPINDFVTISKDPKVKDVPLQVRTEGELEAALPRDHKKRSLVLDEMLEDRFNWYLDTRTIQVSMPAAVLEAGRKKKDKGGMMMMAAAAMGGMMLQMAMGKIAVIAGKALLIGKVALLLSAIVGLKKLVGGGGGHESHPQVVYASSDHHGGGWGRSVEPEEAAQDLAYAAYRPPLEMENHHFH